MKTDVETSLALVCAADEAYAMPLAVTVRSVLENLRSDVHLRLFIIDGGFSARTRQRLLKSWRGFSVSITWLEPELSLLEGFPAKDRASLAPYLLLLLSRLLPTDLQRVIYLDSDLIVLGDLVELWEMPLEGKPCLAARDMGHPYIHREIARPDVSEWERKLPLYRALPIVNYKELGLDPRAEYFNSGVLLIDLELWRRENLAEKFLQCAHENHEHILFWDQYVLNIVLSGRWGRLESTWNRQPFVYRVSDWRDSTFDEEEWKRIMTTPHVIHFSAKRKPWQVPGYTRPERALFYDVLSRTQWHWYHYWPVQRWVGIRGRFERLRDQMKMRWKRFRASGTFLRSRSV